MLQETHTYIYNLSPIICQIKSEIRFHIIQDLIQKRAKHFIHSTCNQNHRLSVRFENTNDMIDMLAFLNMPKFNLFQ